MKYISLLIIVFWVAFVGYMFWKQDSDFKKPRDYGNGTGSGRPIVEVNSDKGGFSGTYVNNKNIPQGGSGGNTDGVTYYGTDKTQ